MEGTLRLSDVIQILSQTSMKLKKSNWFDAKNNSRSYWTYFTIEDKFEIIIDTDNRLYLHDFDRPYTYPPFEDFLNKLSKEDKKIVLFNIEILKEAYARTV